MASAVLSLKQLESLKYEFGNQTRSNKTKQEGLPTTLEIGSAKKRRSDLAPTRNPLLHAGLAGRRRDSVVVRLHARPL